MCKDRSDFMLTLDWHHLWPSHAFIFVFLRQGILGIHLLSLQTTRPVFSCLIAHVALRQAPHMLWLRTGSHPPLAFCKAHHLSADFLTTPPTGFHMPPVVLELTTELRMTLNFWSSSLHLPSARITVIGHHTLPKLPFVSSFAMCISFFMGTCMK